MQEFMKKIGAGIAVAWSWVAPYLATAWQWFRRFWKKYQLTKIFILGTLLIILVTSLYLFYLAKTADVKDLRAGLAQTTVVYDKDGDAAGNLYNQKGTFVTIDKISDNMLNAVVSTEDKRFYQHGGFDIRGMGRALVGLITHGSIQGGGSTITQQLAKNAKLGQEQTYIRKAKELFLAIEIEKHYTKKQILEMYLNNSYFGNGVFGIEDASHKYFGKSAKNLTVDEAAVLAGMLKGPEIYNPIKHMKNALNRRDTVLQLMVDNHKLSQTEANTLMKQSLYLKDDYQENQDSYKYPYYFDAVMDEAENLYGIKASDLIKNGYKIYTTLDQNYQKDLQTTFENTALFPSNAADGTQVQGASVAINPKTGGVMAVVGGRGEHVFRGLNRATSSYRSPGSTMKPLAVYTPAIENGYSATSILKDQKLSYYNVQNYEKTYSGEVPLYQALDESLNAPAVWLLHQIGVKKGYNKVQEFGISLAKEDNYLGLALGGLTNGTTPQKMGTAYAAFANGGKLPTSHYITKIVDASGTVVVDAEPKTTQIMTKATANKMTSLLQGVFSSGTGINAKPYGVAMAGKTGTTENGTGGENASDQWIIGYTPDVVLTTWIGYDQVTKDHYLTGSSADGLSNLFRTEATAIVNDSPKTKFSVSDVAQEQQEKNSGTTSNSSSSNSTFGDLQKTFEDGAQKVKDGFSKAQETISGWLKGFQ